MKNTQVSVVVPFYNLGDYLEECIDSVLAQTYSNIEIIIINDGSTDKNSLEVLQKYINHENKNITVINTENRGLPRARNFAIESSQGEYIVCLDADDKIEPDYILEATKLLDQNADIDIAAPWLQEFENGSKLSKTPEFDPILLLVGNNIPVASMFRRSAWERVKGYPIHEPRGYEDWGFWVSIVASGGRWEVLEHPYFLYRIRQNSMVTGSRQRHNELFLQIISNNSEFVSKNSIDALSRTHKMFRDADLYSCSLEEKIEKLKIRISEFEDESAYLKDRIAQIESKKFYQFYFNTKNDKSLFNLTKNTLFLFLPDRAYAMVSGFYRSIKSGLRKAYKNTIGFRK